MACLWQSAKVLTDGAEQMFAATVWGPEPDEEERSRIGLGHAWSELHAALFPQNLLTIIRAMKSEGRR